MAKYLRREFEAVKQCWNLGAPNAISHVYELRRFVAKDSDPMK